VILVKKVGIFLIIVALVIGMSGCGGIAVFPGFTPQYAVTISSSRGGTVTEPGEGLFRYARGTVVNLVAEPDRGYEFVGWVSNLGTIADVHDATTTMTLNQNYCFVIASFDD